MATELTRTGTATLEPILSMGQEDAAHGLEVVATPAIAHWSVATGLTATKVDTAGFGQYQAASYDELIFSL